MKESKFDLMTAVSVLAMVVDREGLWKIFGQGVSKMSSTFGIG